MRKTDSVRASSAIAIRDERIYTAPTGRLSFTDPADYLDFARPFAAPDAARFDNRSDQRLEEAAFSDATALLRERALWELVDRRGSEAHPVVERFLAEEEDRACRAHALWLLQKTADRDTTDRLAGYFSDDDPEVAEWSRLLVEELSGEAVDPGPQRDVIVHEDRTFDQTLPLLISGHTLITVPQLGRIKVTLSPLWFEQILGRVMACTNKATFDNTLVIEKALDNLHPDGTQHYEAFLFKGISYALVPGKLFEHHYESVQMRPFYPSGTVEVGKSIPVAVPLARVAGTTIDTGRGGGDKDVRNCIGDGERADRIREQGFVSSVRGRYSGWAAVNLETVLETNFVPPGAVQLSNPTHPEAGPMTNAVLFGTFRGKISDHTGDGLRDVNTIPSHCTLDGEHDLYADGTGVPDPFLQ
ncbi:MAG: HEAT repeat domain-containing protein [Acidobacteriota bacterium]